MGASLSLAGIAGALLQGVLYTLLVTAVCVITGLVSGLWVAGLRRARVPWVGPWIAVYTYVFRGVPVIVLLFLVYFGLPSLGLRVAPLTAMALSLGLTAGAYLAEVFRGAFEAIDDAELMAATAAGMTRWQILAFIEFPQMLRFAIPGMINEFTTVLKYSPFAYTVGVPEMMKQATTLTAVTLDGVRVYLVVGVLYFVIYRIVVLGIRRLASRYQVVGFQSA
jgi:polar amino acid transport system permease protein